LSDHIRKWIPHLAVFVIYLAFGATKVLLTVASPYYDAQDKTNLHFTENAVQYRYAEMIAEGRGIPEVDTRIQHPEGVQVSEELTITLERVSGYLYRALTALGYDTPFHTYSVYFIAFFSSLAVFPLYLAGARLWGGWLGGLLVVCFYVVMPPAWMRSITSFSREDFTLTFLFAGLVCFGLSQGKNREPWMPWAAGVALALASISWHISGFVLVILFAYAIVAYGLIPAERRQLFDALWPILLVLFLAGIGTDLLRNKWFVTSSTMLIGYGLLAAHLLGERFNLGTPVRIGILIGFPAIAHVALLTGVGENIRAYSHAFEVIYYKLRFGLIKPEDPLLMTADARGMWSSSFRSPTFGSAWSMFSTLLIVSAAAAILAVRDLAGRTLPRAERFFTYCFFAFLAGYIAFDRIQVFFVFFAALIVGRWLLTLRARRPVVIAALIVLIGYEVYNDTRLFITVYRTPGLERLITWVRDNTQRDDAILTAFQVGPSILTYTGRPIVLHPKFESYVIRDKTQRFVEGLFESESTFYQLAREWQADWYVYQASTALDTSLESPRYVAGRSSISPESALYRFHFAPEKLTHFHLAYQDSYFRIYRVGRSPETRGTIDYQPVFDLSLFTQQPGTMPDDNQIAKVMGELGNPQTRARLAAALYADGRFVAAADEYARLVSRGPSDSELLLRAANAFQKAGNDRKAFSHYLMALRANPDLSMNRFETDNGILFLDGARLLLEAGRTASGTRWLEQAVARLPRDLEAATNLGMLYSNTGRLDEARRTFDRVLLFGDKHPPVYLQLGLLEQKSGEHQRAIERLERYLQLTPGSPDAAAVRQAIRQSQSALNGS
jgi:Tfp pilus assembly protein PilF